jgi:hypothetical protein
MGIFPKHRVHRAPGRTIKQTEDLGEERIAFSVNADIKVDGARGGLTGGDAVGGADGV